jgi:catechol 2,3-dioxygenase-like lactoylglutathione lyase family enzyme
MYHHVAIAVKDAAKAHEFYTGAMGFTMVKVVKRQTPEGGWTKHIFYDTGHGELFAIWDLRGIEGVVIDADWKGGLSTGAGLPWWVNHVAFGVASMEDLQRHKQRWLDTGHNVSQVDHEFIVSIYTKDPDGTLVEFTYQTRALTSDDIEEGEALLADDSPATEPEYEGEFFRSPVRARTEVLATAGSTAAVR